jgi:hypothetical protein
VSPIEIVALVALVCYAVYRQTRQQEVVGNTRFKLAIVYGVVGLVVGGFYFPDTGGEATLLLASIVLSAVVGVLRGRLTRVWAGPDGRVLSQGTPLTIGLFLGMIVVKFGMGTVAYFTGVSDHGGFGEILLMIAVMVALQAELIWRRARPLGARRSEKESVA